MCIILYVFACLLFFFFLMFSLSFGSAIFLSLELGRERLGFPTGDLVSKTFQLSSISFKIRSQICQCFSAKSIAFRSKNPDSYAAEFKDLFMLD